jgi:hypothetical protein
MTNLTFFADTRPDRRQTRLTGDIARARERCHLVFAISRFKGASSDGLALWKSASGTHRGANLLLRILGTGDSPHAICSVHIHRSASPGLAEA